MAISREPGPTITLMWPGIISTKPFISGILLGASAAGVDIDQSRPYVEVPALAQPLCTLHLAEQ